MDLRHSGLAQSIPLSRDNCRPSLKNEIYIPPCQSSPIFNFNKREYSLKRRHLRHA